MHRVCSSTGSSQRSLSAKPVLTAVPPSAKQYWTATDPTANNWHRLALVGSCILIHHKHDHLAAKLVEYNDLRASRLQRALLVTHASPPTSHLGHRITGARFEHGRRVSFRPAVHESGGSTSPDIGIHSGTKCSYRGMSFQRGAGSSLPKALSASASLKTARWPL